MAGAGSAHPVDSDGDGMPDFLDSGQPTALPDRVQLTWQTLGEMGLYGLHLYR